MIALLVFVTIVAVAADVAVCLFLVRWFRSRYRRRYRLQIDNLGNVPVSFDVRIQPAHEGLCLSLGGGIILPEGVESGPELEQSPAQKTSVAATTVRAGGQVGSSVRKLRGASQVLTGLVAGVGGLLPASVGQPLRDLAAGMRQRQVQINRIENAPRQTTGRVKAITRALPGRKSGGQSGQRPAGAAQPGAGIRAGRANSSALSGWTESVMSGGTATIDILASPRGWPRETHDCPIVITSTVVGQPAASRAREEAHIRILRVSWFEHAWPYLAFVLALVLQTWLLVSLFASLA